MSSRHHFAPRYLQAMLLVTIYVSFCAVTILIGRAWTEAEGDIVHVLGVVEAEVLRSVVASEVPLHIIISGMTAIRW